ncbi:MAG: peptidylprolyl isomerase [Comamonas sp.]
MMFIAFSRLLRLLGFVVVLAGFSAAMAQPSTPAASGVVLVGEGALAVTDVDVMAEVAPMDAASRARVLDSPELVQRVARDIYLRRRLTQEAQAQKLDQQPVTQAQLRIVRERVLADALIKHAQQQSRPSGVVLRNLAEQNYKSNPAQFQQPERVHARHILIALTQKDAQATAESLRQQLIGGADFQQLAREHSTDQATAPKGGDLGFFARGKMVKPFEDAAFALEKPGDISPVVQSPAGYHIIQLVEKRPAGVPPFDEIRDELMQAAAAKIDDSVREELVRPVMDALPMHADAIAAFVEARKKDKK